MLVTTACSQKRNAVFPGVLDSKKRPVSVLVRTCGNAPDAGELFKDCCVARPGTASRDPLRRGGTRIGPTRQFETLFYRAMRHHIWAVNSHQGDASTR